MVFELLLESITYGLLMGGIYALVSIGLTLIFGVMRIVNFAQCDMLMLGMYTTYWLFTLYGIDPYLSLVVVAPLFFLLGVAIQKSLINPILNAREENQILLTLGLMMIVQNLALLLWKTDYRIVVTTYSSITYTAFGIIVGINRLVAFICAICLALALYFILMKTDVGIAIRATSQDREVAALMGISTQKIYFLVFGLGTSLAAIAGSLLSTFYYMFPTVGLIFTLMAFVVVVVGGMGDFVGALIGGLFIGVVEFLSAIFIADEFKQVIVMIVFILILLLKPSGLFGRSRA